MFAGNVRETTSISSLVTTSTHDVYDIKMADKLVVWLSVQCIHEDWVVSKHCTQNKNQRKGSGEDPTP